VLAQDRDLRAISPASMELIGVKKDCRRHLENVGEKSKGATEEIAAPCEF